MTFMTEKYHFLQYVAGSVGKNIFPLEPWFTDCILF